MFEFLNFFILILLSIIVCCNRNPMYAIFSFISLIVTLFIFIITHDVEFIAIAFLIIYIGAIMVLFLFVIFLLNLYTAKPYKSSLPERNNLRLWEGFLVLIVIIKILMLFWFLKTDINTLFLAISSLGGNTDFNKYDQMVLFANIKIHLLHFYDINTIGYLIYAEFKIYLIFCALILFVAIIGGVFLVSTKSNLM